MEEILGLSKATIISSRSLHYTYYVSAPNLTKPTLLLLHGFPDSAELYAGVVKQLLLLPFQLIVPDLLGYAGTSKPVDPSMYQGKAMADDLVDILKQEKVSKVIVIGHDWGAFLAQHFFFHQREYVAGIILISVAYLAIDPTQKFDLEFSLEQSEKLTGYPRFAYWELFTASDGAAVLENHIESFWTVLHGNRPDWMRDMFCIRGAMRDFLEADKRVPVHEYADNKHMQDNFIARYRRDGFEGPLCWYKALKENVHFESDKDLTADRLTVSVPLLFVGSHGDAVCMPELIEIPKEKGLVPDLTVYGLDCNHWIPLAKADKLGEIIIEFLKQKFLS